MKTRLPVSAHRMAGAALSFFLFASNTVFARAYETNFWESRRRVHTQTVRVVEALNSRAADFSWLDLPLDRVSLRSVRAGRQAGGWTVALILDVHRNAEAQGHIAAVLERASAAGQDGPILVGVEAAYGPFDFAPFQAFPDAAQTRRLAGEFLSDHRVSAPSFVGLATSSSSLKLQGMDDPILYERNVAAYQAAARIKPRILDAWKRDGAALEREKERIYNPALRRLDRWQSDHRAGSLSLAAYLSHIFSAGAGLDAPNVVRFVKAAELERRLDVGRVEAERRRFLERLAPRLTGEEAADLARVAAAFRSGAVSHGAFYERLKALCEAKGLSLSSAPALRTYVEYVELAQGVDAEALSVELDRVESEAFGNAIRSPREANIHSQADRLFLRGKLLNFALTPAEWKKYSGMNDGGEWEAFQAFYRLADLRSDAMSQNLADALSASRGKRAVLVVGGFHAEAIEKKLAEHGAAIAVIQPRLTAAAAGDPSGYLSVFDEEKTPLEKRFEGKKLFLGDAGQMLGAASPKSARRERTAREFLTLQALRNAPAGSAPVRGPTAPLVAAGLGLVSAFSLYGAFSVEAPTASTLVWIALQIVVFLGMSSEIRGGAALEAAQRHFCGYRLRFSSELSDDVKQHANIVPDLSNALNGVFRLRFAEFVGGGRLEHGDTIRVLGEGLARMRIAGGFRLYFHVDMASKTLTLVRLMPAGSTKRSGRMDPGLIEKIKRLAAGSEASDDDAVKLAELLFSSAEPKEALPAVEDDEVLQLVGEDSTDLNMLKFLLSRPSGVEADPTAETQYLDYLGNEQPPFETDLSYFEIIYGLARFAEREEKSKLSEPVAAYVDRWANETWHPMLKGWKRAVEHSFQTSSPAFEDIGRLYGHAALLAPKIADDIRDAFIAWAERNESRPVRDIGEAYSSFRKGALRAGLPSGRLFPRSALRSEELKQAARNLSHPPSLDFKAILKSDATPVEPSQEAETRSVAATPSKKFEMEWFYPMVRARRETPGAWKEADVREYRDELSTRAREILDILNRLNDKPKQQPVLDEAIRFVATARQEGRLVVSPEDDAAFQAKLNPVKWNSASKSSLALVMAWLEPRLDAVWLSLDEGPRLPDPPGPGEDRAAWRTAYARDLDAWITRVVPSIDRPLWTLMTEMAPNSKYDAVQLLAVWRAKRRAGTSLDVHFAYDLMLATESGEEKMLEILNDRVLASGGALRNQLMRAHDARGVRGAFNAYLETQLKHLDRALADFPALDRALEDRILIVWIDDYLSKLHALGLDDLRGPGNQVCFMWGGKAMYASLLQTDWRSAVTVIKRGEDRRFMTRMFDTIGVWSVVQNWPTLDEIPPGHTAYVLDLLDERPQKWLTALAPFSELFLETMALSDARFVVLLDAPEGDPTLPPLELLTDKARAAVETAVGLFASNGWSHTVIRAEDVVRIEFRNARPAADKEAPRLGEAGNAQLYSSLLFGAALWPAFDPGFLSGAGVALAVAAIALAVLARIHAAARATSGADIDWLISNRPLALGMERYRIERGMSAEAASDLLFLSRGPVNDAAPAPDDRRPERSVLFATGSPAEVARDIRLLQRLSATRSGPRAAAITVVLSNHTQNAEENARRLAGPIPLEFISAGDIADRNGLDRCLLGPARRNGQRLRFVAPLGADIPAGLLAMLESAGQRERDVRIDVLDFVNGVLRSLDAAALGRMINLRRDYRAFAESA